MSEVKCGTWVEIENILLEPVRRSNHLPEETKKVPFIMRVKGFLLEDAKLNELVEVQTLIGRKIQGRLVKVNPEYSHGYGSPIYELLHIGEAEKQLLK
jgi:2-amino-4-ketopentanoate thiolase alpha subunit